MLVTLESVRYVAVNLQFAMFTDPPSSRLLQVRLDIINYETCHDKRPDHIYDAHHICIGSVSTRRSGICLVGYYYIHLIVKILEIISQS